MASPRFIPPPQVTDYASALLAQYDTGFQRRWLEAEKDQDEKYQRDTEEYKLRVKLAMDQLAAAREQAAAARKAIQDIDVRTAAGAAAARKHVADLVAGHAIAKIRGQSGTNINITVENGLPDELKYRDEKRDAITQRMLESTGTKDLLKEGRGVMAAIDAPYEKEFVDAYEAAQEMTKEWGYSGYQGQVLALESIRDSYPEEVTRMVRALTPMLASDERRLEETVSSIQEDLSAMNIDPQPFKENTNSWIDAYSPQSDRPDEILPPDQVVRGRGPGDRTRESDWTPPHAKEFTPDYGPARAAAEDQLRAAEDEIAAVMFPTAPEYAPRIERIRSSYNRAYRQPSAGGGASSAGPYSAPAASSAPPPVSRQKYSLAADMNSSAAKTEEAAAQRAAEGGAPPAAAMTVTGTPSPVEPQAPSSWAWADGWAEAMNPDIPGQAAPMDLGELDLAAPIPSSVAAEVLSAPPRAPEGRGAPRLAAPPRPAPDVQRANLLRSQGLLDRNGAPRMRRAERLSVNTQDGRDAIAALSSNDGDVEKALENLRRSQRAQAIAIALGQKMKGF